jgi:hypothetical protein
MILAHRGSGSGGYLDYVFRSAAKELFNIDINDEPLEFNPLRTGGSFLDHLFFSEENVCSTLKCYKL